MPATPHVMPSFDRTRGFGGRQRGDEDRVGRGRGVPGGVRRRDRPLKAPAEPKACCTAPPVAVPPSPNAHAIDTGDTRSDAAAAIPMEAPTWPPGGTLAVSVGAAASKLADLERLKFVPPRKEFRVQAATPLPWSSIPIDVAKKSGSPPAALAALIALRIGPNAPFAWRSTVGIALPSPRLQEISASPFWPTATDGFDGFIKGPEIGWNPANAPPPGTRVALTIVFPERQAATTAPLGAAPTAGSSSVLGSAETRCSVLHSGSLGACSA